MTPVRLRLREWRLARELTQEQLAESAGVRQATISDLERGASQRLDFDLLDRLCAALEIEPGELLVRDLGRKPGRAK